MEYNTVERAIKTEADTKTVKKKVWENLAGLCQHPHHVKVSPWGKKEEEEGGRLFGKTTTTESKIDTYFKLRCTGNGWNYLQQ